MSSPSSPNLIKLTFESHELLISHKYTISINRFKVLKVSQGFLPPLCPITIFSDPCMKKPKLGISWINPYVFCHSKFLRFYEALENVN